MKSIEQIARELAENAHKMHEAAVGLQQAWERYNQPTLPLLADALKEIG